MSSQLIKGDFKKWTSRPCSSSDAVKMDKLGKKYQYNKSEAKPASAKFEITHKRERREESSRQNIINQIGIKTTDKYFIAIEKNNNKNGQKTDLFLPLKAKIIDQIKKKTKQTSL